MRLRIWTALFLLVLWQPILDHTNAQASLVRGKEEAGDSSANARVYAVIGATASQEASLKAQIEFIQPSVRPLRIVFVPHWQYIDTARIFRLHVPAGYTSAMFTHLPSRTTFIDRDRYLGKDWLGYWMAHELGHLATNSVKEVDAERVAREYRNRLKEALARDRQ